MTIEARFDVPFVAALALREKQIQQNYRPIISVHKWFARRPGSLFRALTLAEFGNAPLRDLYYTSNDFPGRKVADPFMGGGTPLIEANRVGCDVTGFDINPMAAWIVREEIEHLDLASYQRAATHVLTALRRNIEDLYITDCPHYGDTNVPVKYFLWVKVIDCSACGREVDLFPGYLVSKDARHPKSVFVCRKCGDLNHVEDSSAPGACLSCNAELHMQGPAKRGRCGCPHCGHENKYPRANDGPLRHRLFAIEYFNPYRKAEHKGRFFKKPDAKDFARVAASEDRWSETQERFVPDQRILSGDETDRLHRWGYRNYKQMFSARQLLGLELTCCLISEIKDERVRHALATNLSDLLRYQNLLCRYDTWALKSLDIFSVHGFPIGLIQCESNLLGIVNSRGSNVGSGGWTNIIEKYSKAKSYCDAPFEVKRQGSRNFRVQVEEEWIGENLDGKNRRAVAIHCADPTTVELAPNSLDAVFTDPPYFGNVQYGELMDFCYVWLRRLVGNSSEGFWRPSTRTEEELTGNVTKSRGLTHFTEGLSRIYRHMAKALKPGAPLAFTYHHNKIDAYYAVGVAILDSGLICSATFPCPAEMGGSIHIYGSSSSIVDTVFVCRDTGHTSSEWLFKSDEELARIVNSDLSQIAQAGRKPTAGDARCIIFGHLTRMAIWVLNKEWEAELSVDEKLGRFAIAVSSLANTQQLLDTLETTPDAYLPAGPLFSEENALIEARDVVSF